MSEIVTTMAVVAGPKIKLSQVLAQANDLEVPLLDEHKILEMRQVYITLFVDAPMEACEVTDGQVSALQYVLSMEWCPMPTLESGGLTAHVSNEGCCFQPASLKARARGSRWRCLAPTSSSHGENVGGFTPLQL